MGLFAQKQKGKRKTTQEQKNQVTPSFKEQFVYLGNARQLDEKRHRLTRKLHDAIGAIWCKEKVDLSQDFRVRFEAFLGCRYADSDGIAFVWQNEGLDALGGGSSGMGYSGISPSLAVEIDNFADDFEGVGDTHTHVALTLNGNIDHRPGSGGYMLPVVADPSQEGDEEGCRQYLLEITWQPEPPLLTVNVNGKERILHKGDIMGKVFGNTKRVYWGFTAANNYERFNTQGIKLLSVEKELVLPPDSSLLVQDPLIGIPAPLPSNAPEISYTKRNIPDQLHGRRVKTGKTVYIENETVDILVYDDEREDGDTISLYLNGEWILQKHALTKKPQEIRVKLNRYADNYLVLYAHNEGRIPPNTAAIQLKDGKQSKIILLSSDKNHCGAVNFAFDTRIHKCP